MELSPPMGRTASPFICEGKAQVTREIEGEKSEEEECLWGHVVLHLPYAGPVVPVDNDGNGSTLRPCSPLAPHVGIIRWSWLPILSWRAAWSTGTPNRSRRGLGSTVLACLTLLAT
jgi:hypothetical protein